MKIKCQTCIYGGICIVEEPHDFSSTEPQRWRINYHFKTAYYKYNDVMHVLNYDTGDHGCRAASFKSKEEVCLNNSFSEYKTLKDGIII